MSVALLSNASDWLNASDIPGIRQATNEEKLWLSQTIKGMISYDFENQDFLIYDGDLTIPANFIASGHLVVRGNLTIKGMYDDEEGLRRNYRTGYGFTIVMGNMSATHIYNWASLYVKGDLNVSGLIFTISNDFYFEVDGKLNAKGLFIDDKYANFNEANLEFAFLSQLYEREKDFHLLHNGFRHLLPEFISEPEFRDAIDQDYMTLESQPINHGAIWENLLNGKPVLRDVPAPPELPTWIESTINSETSEAELLSLIGKDPLVNQLMAARYDLSKKIIKELEKTEDPIVLKWLSYEMSERTIGERISGIAATIRSLF